MKKGDAIETAINYAFAHEQIDLENMNTENVTSTEFEDGTWKVELTSDVAVYVNPAGEASYFNSW